ncbi:AraC family transcriptional regulator [Pontibacterium sp. N1Y112]|uniref:AraC family transcriptional regulator n=1 Tax=Pontibacterium sinense TaxID=2781979 RepID=A0A8J7FAA0_9GAMM|nr:AraC family transcriptional regulator [Pontibacterium sinense]MBE9397172.1 AraC family transcriptional regulator [Pontibacterium sinense]
MSTERHSISIHFARTLVASAKRHGVDHQQLLRFAGLNEQLLENPGLRITPDQLSRMMQEMWRVADDEFMCMGSQPSRHGVFTLMSKQAVRCRNLRAVYHHLGHFYNLVADALILDFTITDNEARFSLRLTDPDRDPDNTLREFLLLLWHRFPSWLIGQRIPLKYVTLDFPEPAHSAEHRLMYPCTAKYNQSANCLVFSTDMLDEPVVQTPRTLSAYLRRAPLDWFKRQAYYPVFTRRVMDYLEQAPELAATNMDDIAAELHVTSRTLRRKLADEGTSFQELKDDVRRDAAIHYLSQPSIPISQISRQLGFSEPAAFTRAFKQWTGVPPSVYRRS